MNTDHPSSDPSADSSLQTSPTARAERGQRTYVGRFAPSPTGPLHAGSMAAALASLLDARAHGGRWHVRIEDIDPPREVAGAARQILALLDACGMRANGWACRRRPAAVKRSTPAPAGMPKYPPPCPMRGG